MSWGQAFIPRATCRFVSDCCNSEQNGAPIRRESRAVASAVTPSVQELPRAHPDPARAMMRRAAAWTLDLNPGAEHPAPPIAVCRADDHREAPG